jgi:hypothetical protein
MHCPPSVAGRRQPAAGKDKPIDSLVVLAQARNVAGHRTGTNDRAPDTIKHFKPATNLLSIPIAARGDSGAFRFPADCIINIAGRSFRT